MLVTPHYNDSRLLDALSSGQLAVLRTDTLYGIVACASIQRAVENIFTLKGRSPDKPLIVLVASIDDIPNLSSNAKHTYERLNTLQPTSIIVPSTHEPVWLTRGHGSVAYRVPHRRDLRELLAHSGPLVAPSANPQGLEPARTIDHAISYFADAISVYVDAGEVPEDTPPSTIIQLEGTAIKKLR